MSLLRLFWRNVSLHCPVATLCQGRKLKFELAIPFFGDFVSLIGATLGTFLCFITEGWMWLHDNWGHRKTDKSLRFKSLVALNVFLIVLGIFIVITGTWASVVSINDSYKNGAITSPFSCADNSG